MCGTLSQEGLLQRLTGGNLFDAKLDSAGRVVVDRDGTHFGYVLNCLRLNWAVLQVAAAVQKLPSDEVESLVKECFHYELTEVAAVLRRSLDMRRAANFEDATLAEPETYMDYKDMTSQFRAMSSTTGALRRLADEGGWSLHPTSVLQGDNYMVLLERKLIRDSVQP